MTLGAGLLLGAVLLALIILRRPTVAPTDLALASARGTDE
jgi:xanthosine utilization system XapX-like protein